MKFTPNDLFFGIEEQYYNMAFSVADQVERPIKRCLKILVVDDDDLNRRMMRLLLVRDGHDVQVVANGIEAVDAVKEQQFDLVFMDLQMPLMDGFEASQRIREWENGNQHTYIVALTASYMPEEGQHLFESGIDNYISKPFEVEHIQKLLSIIARSERPSAMEDHSAGAGLVVHDDILDVQRGLQQFGGDEKTYRELLSDFVQGLPGRINTLDGFLSEQDMVSLAREAHNLKGVSSNLGALQLSDYARKLDKQSNEGYTDKTQTLMLDVKRAGNALQKAATDFLEKKEKIVATALRNSLED